MTHADPVRQIQWGARSPIQPAELSEYRRLLRNGHIFLITDRDGKSLQDPNFGTRRLINAIQQDIWTKHVLRIRKPFDHGSDVGSPDDISSVLLTLRDGAGTIEADAFLPAEVITRELLSKKEIFPEDIIDVTRVVPPLIRGKPAQYMFFVQRQHFRCIIANLRPETNPQWTEWPTEEQEWLSEVFADFSLIYQYGHLPRAISELNKHNVPFSLGVKAEPMTRVLDAVREGTNIDTALEQAFADYPWEAVFDEWKMNPQWEKREPVFNDAVRALRAGAPGGAVLQFLAQIEGVIMDYLLRFGDGVDKRGKGLPWGTRMKQLEARIRNDQSLGRIRKRTIETALSYLRDSGLYEDFSWLKPPPSFGRHPILHGCALAYPTAANAIRALLALDALYWVTGFQHRTQNAASPAQPDPPGFSGERFTEDPYGSQNVPTRDS